MNTLLQYLNNHPSDETESLGTELCDEELEFPADDPIIRWEELHAQIPLCRSQIYNLIKKGEFPPPVKLGPRASGWFQSQVHKWKLHRLKKSRRNFK